MQVTEKMASYFLISPPDRFTVKIFLHTNGSDVVFLWDASEESCSLKSGSVYSFSPECFCFFLLEFLKSFGVKIHSQFSRFKFKKS